MRKLSSALFVLLIAAFPFIYTNCQKGNINGSLNSSAGSSSSGTPSGPTPSPSPGSGPGPGPASVLQYHNQNTRAGVYVDASITKTTAPNYHLASHYPVAVNGNVYAQPLFVDHGGVQDLLIVTTEQNHVTAIDANLGTTVWDVSLGTPVSLGSLPCGNINPLGITGTPVIDPQSRLLYVDAMTTPDGGATIKHLIYALSIDTGATQSGWPVDVNAKAKFGSTSFTSNVQNQRGALLLQNGYLYVPYGGHFGDCGSYHGWVVAVPVNNPSSVSAWSTGASEGGIWAPSGVVGDGTNTYAVTGNTGGTSTWQGGEAVLRFTPPVNFSGQNADFFSPSNWKSLDNADLDLGGSGTILFDASGATPSQLALALGKDGNAYLLNRGSLGGVGAPLNMLNVASSEILSSSTAYSTSSGTFVAFRNPAAVGCSSGSGDLMALKVSAASPPTLSVAWCATQNGKGAPIVTTPDGSSQFIVWSVGAENSNRLYGFDGVTGQVIFNGGGTNEHMSTVQHFQTPIAAKGRIYVAANGKVYAFSQ